MIESKTCPLGDRQRIAAAMALAALGGFLTCLVMGVSVTHTSKSYADGLADGRAECAHDPSRIESAARWLAEPRGTDGR